MGLDLRPYQADTLVALRNGFAAGRRTQILYAPTGAGKTEMAIALLDATRDKRNNSAMILDRIILCDQTSQRLEKYSIPHGVMQAGHWRFRPYENIQICSAQTLEKRGDFPDLKLLVVDECFPAGTMISTPTGDKDISIVRCGDTVFNASGIGIVMGTMARPADELVKLEFEDGRTIECTGNHPIFTDRGWVKASEMEVGRVSYSIQGLRLLWENFCANYENRLRQGGGVEQLQKLGESEDLLQILLQEVEKSDERPIVSRQDEGNPKENKASANSTRREWQIAASAADCFASRFGYWMGVGVSDSNKDEAFKDWISNLLQAGHCQRGDENWDRVGRWFSLLSSAKSTRFQEDRISCFPRLDCISVVKRESVIPVFNLHISGHPSYFANGKLVHNCHTTRAQTVEFIKNNPDIRVIGLSATPFTKGLGKIYEGVISTITTKELVDQQVLVPLRVFIAKEIDMTGAKKVAGEWSAKESTTRGMKITGDIVAEWVKKTHEIYGRPRKTIVFCSGVNHGADLAKKFADAGYNFISISYRDDDQFKTDVIEDFSRPDTEIHGLIATDILTKGFDAPDVMIGISARPFSKSLSSHIQQMGRVMRGMPHAPEEKPFAVWLDHCIASGQKVLTHRGLVPIEEILLNDKIWDGHDFVSHKGVVSRGKRPVITYSGLTATPDHLVYTTDEGWCSFGYCADKQKAIVTTGVGGKNIWQRDGYFTRCGVVGRTQAQVHARFLRMYDVRISFNNFFVKFGGWANQRLQAVQSAKTSSRLAQCKSGSNEVSLQQQEKFTVRQLRWKGNPVQVRFSDFMRSLDSRELGLLAEAQGYGAGQDKQRWPLRSGKYSLGKENREHQKPTNIKVDAADAQVQTGASGDSICRRVFAWISKCWIDLCANRGEISQAISETERQVWDILDCGPRNSFTCEGLLVHNSGNYLRFQEDWDDVYNNGVHELDEGREKAKKEKTDKEKKESCCPRCAHVWQNYSDVCLSCGFVRERKNQVEAVAGELHELKTANKLDNKQDYWSMCQFKIKYHGWNEKRALAAYKTKFGVWPKALHKEPITPSDQFERDAKASLIRYLKGKKAA